MSRRDPQNLDKNVFPNSYYFYNDKLKILIQAAGYDPKDYATHSMRRGAADTAALQQAPLYAIKAIGRWKSEVYTKYTDLNTQEASVISQPLI